MSRRTPEPDCGWSYEQRFEWANVFGEVLRDVSGHSDGTEWRLGAGTERRRGRLKFAPYLMLAARNARLNDYYYGVNASEAAADRPAYQPGGGVHRTLGPDARYDLTDRWPFLARLSATFWTGGLRPHPLLEDPVPGAGFSGL